MFNTSLFIIVLLIALSLFNASVSAEDINSYCEKFKSFSQKEKGKLSQISPDIYSMCSAYMQGNVKYVWGYPNEHMVKVKNSDGGEHTVVSGKPGLVSVPYRDNSSSLNKGANTETNSNEVSTVKQDPHKKIEKEDKTIGKQDNTNTGMTEISNKNDIPSKPLSFPVLKFNKKTTSLKEAGLEHMDKLSRKAKPTSESSLTTSKVAKIDKADKSPAASISDSDTLSIKSSRFPKTDANNIVDASNNKKEGMTNPQISTDNIVNVASIDKKSVNSLVQTTSSVSKDKSTKPNPFNMSEPYYILSDTIDNVVAFEIYKIKDKPGVMPIAYYINDMSTQKPVGYVVANGSTLEIGSHILSVINESEIVWNREIVKIDKGKVFSSGEYVLKFIIN